MENHIIQSESMTLKISLRFIILTISQLILYISLALGQENISNHINSTPVLPYRNFVSDQSQTTLKYDNTPQEITISF